MTSWWQPPGDQDGPRVHFELETEDIGVDHSGLEDAECSQLPRAGWGLRGGVRKSQLTKVTEGPFCLTRLAKARSYPISHQVTHQRDRDLFAGYSACGQDPRLDSTVLSGLFCCCLGKLNSSLQVGLRLLAQ